MLHIFRIRYFCVSECFCFSFLVRGQFGLNLVHRGEENQHLLGVDIDEVLPDAENNCAESSSDRNGILSVVLTIILRDAFGDDVPVDGSWLDGGTKVDQVCRGAQALVLEVFDIGDLAANKAVGPVDKIGLGLTTNKREVMLSDKLPNECKNRSSLTLGEIDTSYRDELKTHLLGGVNSLTIVDVPLEVIVRLHVDLLPVNNLVVQLVDDLAQNDTIIALIEQVVDVDTINAKGVHPHSEGSLLTSSLNIVIKHGGGSVLLLGQILETVFGVKDVSDEESVYLLVGGNNIMRRDNLGDTESKGVVDHDLSSILEVFRLNTIESAFALVKLVEDVEECEGVLEIFAQVCNSSSLTSLVQMVVDPSDQDGFWGKLLDILELLAFLSKTPNLGGLLKGNGLSNDKSEGLPDEGQNKMRSLVDEILGRHTNELDA